jgi:hypothetical protein
MQKEVDAAAADKASSIIAGRIPMRPQIPSAVIPATAIPAATPHGHPEVIEGYIVAYYYAALTNLFCQACLPPIEQAENSDDIARAIMDKSYSDFSTLDSFLASLDPNEIHASPNAHLYLEVGDSWRHWVKDWAMISKKNPQAG